MLETDQFQRLATKGQVKTGQCSKKRCILVGPFTFYNGLRVSD